MERNSEIYRTYVEILKRELVLKGVENTIRNYGYLGRVDMHETNTEIIHMMIKPR